MADIFISYSRRDKEFVEELFQHLTENEFSVWLDKADLKPGTPNWEQSIRDAVATAKLVILVASPDSRGSTYVQGELSLARAHQLPIYPIWVEGDRWIDCVQLGMVNYQYIDCRADRYESGLNTLVETLRNVRDESKGTFTLSLPTHERAELNLAQFSTLLDMLNFIWLRYLEGWYESFTYGSDWVLANVTTKQLLVPFRWLTVDHNTNDKPMHELFPDWYKQSQQTTIEDTGIQDGDVWAVWEIRRVNVAGIAVNRGDLRQQILSQYGQRDLWRLKSQNCIDYGDVSELQAANYEYKFVIALLNSSQNHVAFVETDEACE